MEKAFFKNKKKLKSIEDSDGSMWTARYSWCPVQLHKILIFAWYIENEPGDHCSYAAPFALSWFQFFFLSVYRNYF
jgi:hypothetical protein